MTPNELVLTFVGLHVCVQFGENRRRNATVRVSTDGQTHAQTQNDFIICPMLYAIAMGQTIIIIIFVYYDLRQTAQSHSTNIRHAGRDTTAATQGSTIYRRVKPAKLMPHTAHSD